MKHALSASTSLSPVVPESKHIAKALHTQGTLPEALDPVYQFHPHELDMESVCAYAMCVNKFPIRYGVCFSAVWPNGSHYEYGMCTFCSLECLLACAVAYGSDSAVRIVRDETQTLH